MRKTQSTKSCLGGRCFSEIIIFRKVEIKKKKRVKLRHKIEREKSWPALKNLLEGHKNIFFDGFQFRKRLQYFDFNCLMADRKRISFENYMTWMEMTMIGRESVTVDLKEFR